MIITSSNDVLKESVLGSHESPPPTWHSARRLRRTFFQFHKCHPLPLSPHCDNTQFPHPETTLPLRLASLFLLGSRVTIDFRNPAMKWWSIIKTGRIGHFQSLYYLCSLQSRKFLHTPLCLIPSLWEHIDTSLKISNIKTNPEDTTSYHPLWIYEALTILCIL